MPNISCNSEDCKFNVDGMCNCENAITLNDWHQCLDYEEKPPVDRLSYKDREALQQHYHRWIKSNRFPDIGVNAFAFINGARLFYAEKVKQYLEANANLLEQKENIR